MNNSAAYCAASIACKTLGSVDRLGHYYELLVHRVWDMLGQFTLAETVVRKVRVQSRC